MKKYLLTALLGAFGLFGFTSATSYTFLGDVEDNSYSPNSFVLSEEHTFTSSDISSFDCSNGGDVIMLDDTSSETTNGDCEFWLDGSSWVTFSSSCTFSAGTVYVGRSDGSVCSSVTLSVGGSSSGGGSDSSEGLLNSTGQAYLSNVLDGINSVVGELIPYMIYIALGLLVVTLGFIAVKWLMSYASGKVTSIFKSKRR